MHVFALWAPRDNLNNRPHQTCHLSVTIAPPPLNPIWQYLSLLWEDGELTTKNPCILRLLEHKGCALDVSLWVCESANLLSQESHHKIGLHSVLFCSSSCVGRPSVALRVSYPFSVSYRSRSRANMTRLKWFNSGGLFNITTHTFSIWDLKVVVMSVALALELQLNSTGQLWLKSRLHSKIILNFCSSTKKSTNSVL